MITTLAGAPEAPDFADFETTARWVVVVATSEARLARHPLVSSAHLVLACWLAAFTPVGQALRAVGMSGRIAKAWLEHEIRPESRADEPVHDRQLMHRIRAIATDHGADQVGVEHIFQAATEDHELDGVRMLRAQAISPARITELVTSIMSQPPVPSIMDRLTDEARAVVVSAGVHARRYQHDRIQPGHLLLGLVDTPSAARDALAAQRVTAEAAGVAFAAIVGEGFGGPDDHVPFSTDAVALMHAAGRQAAHGSISPRALLIAMLNHANGDEQDILRALGADMEQLRAWASGPDAESGRVSATTGRTLPAARRSPNLGVLRPLQSRPPRPTRGWRPEMLLVALAFLPIVGDFGTERWSRLGLAAAAVAAIAIGVGAFLRAKVSRTGPWRLVRMASAAALTIATVSLILETVLT